MLEAVLITVALYSGADPIRLAVLVASLAFPGLLLALMALRWWRSRHIDHPDAALFCGSVASEMRSGATLRSSIAAAAAGLDHPEIAALAQSGASHAQLAAATAANFPDIANELVPAIERSARLGSPSADLFDEIGSIALVTNEVGREVHTALSPARATTLILLGAPAMATWYLVSNRNLTDYLGSPAQRLVVLAGGILCLLAVLAGGALMRGAR